MKVVPPRQPIALGAPSAPTIRTYAITTSTTTQTRPIPPAFQKLLDDYNANPSDAKKRLLLALARQLGITITFSEHSPSPILSPFQQMLLQKQNEAPAYFTPPTISPMEQEYQAFSSKPPIEKFTTILGSSWTDPIGFIGSTGELLYGQLTGRGEQAQRNWFSKTYYPKTLEAGSAVEQGNLPSYIAQSPYVYVPFSFGIGKLLGTTFNYAPRFVKTLSVALGTAGAYQTGTELGTSYTKSPTELAKTSAYTLLSFGAAYSGFKAGLRTKLALKSPTVPGRQLQRTSFSQPYSATGKRVTTPIPSSDFQVSTTTYQRTSTFSGTGKRITIQRTKIPQPFETKTITYRAEPPTKLTQLVDIEFLSPAKKSITGKYTVSKGYKSMSTTIEPTKPPALAKQDNLLPAHYEEAGYQPPRGGAAWEAVKKNISFTSRKGFGEIEDVWVMGQKRGYAPGTKTKFTYTRLAEPLTRTVLKPEVKTIGRSARELHGRSYSISELSKINVVEQPSLYAPITFSAQPSLSSTERLPAQTEIPIVRFQPVQKQSFVQLQTPTTKTKQTYQTETVLKTPSFTRPIKQTTTISTPFKIISPQPPEEEKSTQTGQSYNTYIKKDATKRTRRWQKVNSSPLDFSSAAGLGIIRAKNTAARTFRLEPTTGKPTHNDTYSQAWNSYRYQFYEKLGTRFTYIQRTTYSISTVGEKQEITFAPRYKPKTYKPKKMIL